MSSRSKEEKELEVEDFTQEQRTKLIEDIHKVEEKHNLKFPDNIYQNL